MLVGAMVHLQTIGVSHVERAGITSAHQCRRLGPPPLWRLQVEPVWHIAKLGEPLSIDGRIRDVLVWRLRGGYQPPDAPLRIPDQAVTLQVGQRPRQVVLNKIWVLRGGAIG